MLAQCRDGPIRSPPKHAWRSAPMMRAEAYPNRALSLGSLAISRALPVSSSRQPSPHVSDFRGESRSADCVEWMLQFRRQLTAEQRTRLLEIAQMCLMHRTLRGEVHIPVPQLVEDESSFGESLQT
jgi:hypothetical protein